MVIEHDTVLQRVKEEHDHQIQDTKVLKKRPNSNHFILCICVPIFFFNHDTKCCQYFASFCL
jgi:hypothetical protein